MRHATRFARPACALSFLLATLGAGTAMAQEKLELDVQTFQPAAGPHAIFSLESSSVLEHLQPAATVLLNYASRPLMLRQSGGEDVALVDQQVALHLAAGIGLFDRVQVDLGLPIYLINDSALPGSAVDGGVGDLRLAPKVAILSRDEMPVGLGAQLDVTLPTGDAQTLTGRASMSVAPRVIVDYQIADILLVTNLGVRIMEDKPFGNINAGDRFEYGVGAQGELLDGFLRLGGELFGSTQLSDFFSNARETPLEGVVGAQIMAPGGFSIVAGGGGGVVSGVGAPEFRAFVGLRYALADAQADDLEEALVEDEPAEEVVAPEDRDEDGVPDDEDACPDDPGPADNEGCPLPPADRDGDGVPDDEDTCPDDPGPADNEGCPLPTDRDGDGIPDEQDECPDEPGVRANNGCPPKEVKAVRERGEIKILEKIYFETGKATLKSGSYPLLDQIALILRTNPDITKLEIGGHTDKRGASEANQLLSQQRADAVKAYLVDEAKIAPGRLVATGFGESKPLVPHSASGEQPENRRVEFKILEQAADDGQAGDGQ